MTAAVEPNAREPNAREPEPREPNVDPREVAQFARLADTWWDPAGPFWPLHRLNRLRTGYIRDQLCARLGRDPHAPKPLAGLEILDVGCGGGILTESVAELGAAVRGIDAVARNVAIARSHGAGRDLDVAYAEDTAEALADRGERFDVVLNMEVVEHVPDVPRFMSACASLVRPGGTMFVATINRTLASFALAIVGAEYVLRWLPRGTHRWSWFPRPEELEHHLECAGVPVVARTGVRVNPLTRHFALTSIMAVNYMLVAARPAHGRE